MGQHLKQSSFFPSFLPPSIAAAASSSPLSPPPFSLFLLLHCPRPLPPLPPPPPPSARDIIIPLCSPLASSLNPPPSPASLSRLREKRSKMLCLKDREETQRSGREIPPSLPRLPFLILYYTTFVLFFPSLFFKEWEGRKHPPSVSPSLSLSLSLSLSSPLKLPPSSWSLQAWRAYKIQIKGNIFFRHARDTTQLSPPPSQPSSSSSPPSSLPPSLPLRLSYHYSSSAASAAAAFYPIPVSDLTTTSSPRANQFCSFTHGGYIERERERAMNRYSLPFWLYSQSEWKPASQD